MFTLLILILLLLFVIPIFPYNRGWGYVGRGYGWYPPIGIVLLIIILVLLTH